MRLVTRDVWSPGAPGMPATGRTSSDQGDDRATQEAWSIASVGLVQTVREHKLYEEDDDAR